MLVYFACVHLYVFNLKSHEACATLAYQHFEFLVQ